MLRYLSWLTLLFFGLAIPAALFNLFDKRPQIIINEVGIFDRTAYDDFINWNIIKDVYLKEVYRQKFICLVLDEQARLIVKNNRKSVALSEMMGFQVLNLSLGQLRVDENKLMEFIMAMSKADVPNREDVVKRLTKKSFV